MSLSSLKGNLIAYDTETTGLNPWDSAIFKKYGMYPARPFAFAFMDKYGNSAYVRWEVDPKTRKVIPEKKSKSAMSEFLKDPSIVKVGHNLMYDIRMTRFSGIEFNWKLIHDTQFQAYVFTGGSLPSYALKPLGKLWIDMPEEDQKDLEKSTIEGRARAKKKGWKIANKETHGQKYVRSDYWLADPYLCKKYAIGDVERTMLIHLGMNEAFEEYMQKIYEMEIALSKEVYLMEKAGIGVYPEKLKALRKWYAFYAAKWLKVAEANGGKGMNFNSPKQMVSKFCGELKLKTKKRTATGQPSINNDELKRLSEKNKLAKAILEYKVGQGMISKFINSYERFMVEKNGIYTLHPNFRQTGTKTSRFSCTDPNLQQAASEDSVKKRADVGLKPREAIGPKPGYFWYLPDYSQMEVWIFAFEAEDPIMTKALLAGEDVHKATSMQVWGDRYDFKEKAKLYRKKGKTMQFLKQYGGGASAAADLLDCSKSEAWETINLYDERLPGVNNFVRKMASIAEQQGYIENKFGRRTVVDPNRAYTAVNYLVQGTCADIMKRVMIRLPKVLRAKWKGSSMVLTVHDELAIEAPLKYHCEDLRKDIIKEMQRDSKLLGLPCKLPVSMKYTQTVWSEAKEI